MPIIDDRMKLSRALAAAQAIRSQARSLQDLVGTAPFDTIRDRIDQIIRARNTDITPLLTFTSGQINAAVARQFPLGAPADTFAALTALQSSVAALLTAYAGIYATAGNVMTFAPLTGHQYISVPVTALAALTTPLANVVAATLPLDIEA